MQFSRDYGFIFYPSVEGQKKKKNFLSLVGRAAAHLVELVRVSAASRNLNRLVERVLNYREHLRHLLAPCDPGYALRELPRA